MSLQLKQLQKESLKKEMGPEDNRFIKRLAFKIGHCFTVWHQ